MGWWLFINALNLLALSIVMAPSATRLFYASFSEYSHAISCLQASLLLSTLVSLLSGREKGDKTLLIVGKKTV